MCSAFAGDSLFVPCSCWCQMLTLVWMLLSTNIPALKLSLLLLSALSYVTKPWPWQYVLCVLMVALVHQELCYKIILIHIIIPHVTFAKIGTLVYQYSETNVMHFLFSLFRINSVYMFWALLADPQEVLHKWHLVYCMRVMSVECTRIAKQNTKFLL
jgi:hypothetical protein